MNTNNKIFPDYLDLEIIKRLIDYLLRSENKQHYTFKRFKYYKDEILKLSIVSKKYHTMVSGLISNNAEGCVENWIRLDEYDHSLPPLNKQYSVVKIPIKHVIDYYKNQVLYKSPNNAYDTLAKDSENIDYSKYRKITIGKLLDAEPFFKKIKQCSTTNHDGQLEIQLYYLNSNTLFQIFKRLNHTFKIDKLTLNESFNQSTRQDFQIFKYLQVKHLILDSSQFDSDSFYQHLNYGNLLNGDGSYNNQYLESIKMKRKDHIEPIDLISIYKLPNLKSLSINLLFHDLIRYAKLNTYSKKEKLNSCFDELGGLLNCKSIQQEYTQMVKSILLCSSLKSLLIRNLCNKGIHCFDYSTINRTIINVFLNGIKDLMSSNTIQHLKFENIDFIGLPNDKEHIEIFRPLIYNKSIESFQLVSLNIPKLNYEPIIEYIITNVITVNTTIRYLNLSIDNQLNTSPITILKYLIDYRNDIKGLYHIKMLFTDSQFNQIFDLIKQFSKSTFTNCSIKEITLSLMNFYQTKNIQFTTEYKHIKKRINSWNNLPNKINNLILNLEPFNKD